MLLENFFLSRFDKGDFPLYLTFLFPNGGYPLLFILALAIIESERERNRNQDELEANSVLFPLYFTLQFPKEGYLYVHFSFGLKTR